MNHRALLYIDNEPAICCLPDQSRSKARIGDRSSEKHLHSVLLSLASIARRADFNTIRATMLNEAGVVSMHTVFAGTAIKVKYDAARADIRTILAALTTAVGSSETDAEMRTGIEADDHAFFIPEPSRWKEKHTPISG